MAERALSGIKVLDLSQYIAGPYCTKLLADYGAEVIKLEKPGQGDCARRAGPFLNDDPHPEKSGLFLYLNTNKKGITLDLKTVTGVALFKELVARVGLVVENFEPRVMPALGLDYETLRAVNPGLVMLSISNFGQRGPYRDYKGTEIILSALGGLMYLTGRHGREPLKLGLSQLQYLGGSAGAMAATAAVIGQRYSGEGQRIDLSLMQCVLEVVYMQLVDYSYAGIVLSRRPKGGVLLQPLLGLPIPTRDGYVSPTFYGWLDWQQLVAFLDAPELEDPKFQTAESRVVHQEEMEAILVEKLAKWGKHEIFHAAQQWRFPFGLVQTAEDLVNCPQLKDRGFFASVDRLQAGTVTFPGAPFRMSETPWELGSPAPTLGQHNEDIYGGWLGYSRDDIVALRQSGVI